MIEAAGVVCIGSEDGRLVAFRDVTRVLAAGTGEALDEAAALMEQHDMIVPASSRTAYGALHPAPATT